MPNLHLTRLQVYVESDSKVENRPLIARANRHGAGSEKTTMQKSIAIGLGVGVVITGVFLLASTAFAGGGFDEFGYNYQANVFVGPADGVDRNLDGTMWGNATYGKDLLKMKWSNAWDEARFDGAAWTCDAWEDNQWNGAVPGGSGEVWHYMIKWVGPELEQSPCWSEGGYPIWGEFEVLSDHGTVGGEHLWYAHALPSGYGAN